MEPLADLVDFFSATALWSAAGLFKKNLRSGLASSHPSSSDGGSSGLHTGPSPTRHQHHQQQQHQRNEPAADREVHSSLAPKRGRAARKHKPASSEEDAEEPYDERPPHRPVGGQPRTRPSAPIPTFSQQQQFSQQQPEQRQQQQHCHHLQPEQQELTEQDGIDVHVLMSHHPRRPRTLKPPSGLGLPPRRKTPPDFSARFLHMLGSLPSSAPPPTPHSHLLLCHSSRNNTNINSLLKTASQLVKTS